MKSQFLRLCYSKCRISKENPRSSASHSAYVLQTDSLMVTLRNYEIPLNSGDGKQRHVRLRSERWEGCAYPWSHLRAAVPAEDVAVPSSRCAAPPGQPPHHLCWGSSPVLADRARKGRLTKLFQLLSSPGSRCVTSSGAPDGAERSIWGLEVTSECHHHAEAWPDPNSKSCLGTELNTEPLLLPPQ